MTGQKSVSKKLYYDADNIKDIRGLTIFFAVTFFMFFNVGFFVHEAYETTVRIVVLGYGLLVLWNYRNFIDDKKFYEQRGIFRDYDKFGSNIGKIIAYAVLLFIVVQLVPIESIQNPESFTTVFRSASSMILYFIVIVGFGESFTFLGPLAESKRLGIIWTSALFSLFHGSMILFITNGTFDISLLDHIIANIRLFGELFLVNILFFLVYRVSNYNLIIVSILHGYIDLKKIGVI